MTQEEIDATEPTPGWWARTLHYVNTMREEPVGVALAMQATQEGQQVALNNEITIPSFEKHYGYTKEDDEIAFFVEHAEADAEHSRRQLDLAAKYLDTPELQARALKVCGRGRPSPLGEHQRHLRDARARPTADAAGRRGGLACPILLSRTARASHPSIRRALICAIAPLPERAATQGEVVVRIAGRQSKTSR